MSEEKMTLAERKAKEREERTKLIRKAGKGDKKALKILSGPPYHMKVFTPDEREEYMKQHATEA